MSHTWNLRGHTLIIGRRPLIMGIVNVTPDSFSDGGQFFDPVRAVAHGEELVADGADLLDIGGESTRPGSDSVSLDEELRRVIPVIDGLAKKVSVPLSVDTAKAEVARQAVAAGAAIINDVTGLSGDPAMPSIAVATGAGVVIMHMQGLPKTMQLDPQYGDVVAEVRQYLEERLAVLGALGIEASRIAVDPGIGFGKRQRHNLDLLAHLDVLQGLGRPVCLGASRKGFINRVLDRTGHAEHGDAGTVGVVLHAVSGGAVQIARVHNVRAVHDAVRLFLAVDEARDD